MTTHDEDWNGRHDDRVVGRIIDRVARPEDFAGFREAARARPEAWHELLDGLADDAALGAALEARLETADAVRLPPSRRAVRPWALLSGWAAALLVSALWWTTAAVGGSQPPRGADDLVARQDEGGLLPESGGASAPRLRADGDVAQALPPGAQIARPAGTVVGELPLEILQTRRPESGEGLEVLYLRRVVERTRVDSVLTVGSDEFGRAVPVSIDPTSLLADLH